MDEAAVLRLGTAEAPLPTALSSLLAAQGLELRYIPTDAPIPGSYWGESEAGLLGPTLLVRSDTPVHSALHEACHYLCADPTRRATLDTDAGGDVLEECAVCYLSVLIAATLPGFGRDRMLSDMDAWGYSFRLGSARRWFEEEADDARGWLMQRGLIDALFLPPA
jgi:hypothetical protein